MAEITIAPVAPAETLEHAFITGYAFAGDRGERFAREYSQYAPLEWTRGLRVDGHLVASLLCVPYTMQLEGGEAPLGAVADVACLPEQRRRGHVGRLLRHLLAELRERGTPLAGLYTPHVPLYRRFGWEVAFQNLELRFPVKGTALRRAEPPAGQAERVSADAWRRLDGVYSAAVAGGNGGLNRWEAVWRKWLRGEERTPQDVAVWIDPHGADRGYVIYRETGWQNYRRGDLHVVEAVFLDGDAAHGLIAYLLQHDLSQNAIWDAAEDTPVLHVLDDPGERVHVRRRPGLMLRIVDLPAALAARPCYAAAPAAVTLAVRDAACPWNAGTWRISGEAGRLNAAPSDAEPQLALDITTLAALYNGGLAPETAVRAGLIAVRDTPALAAAHDLLAMRRPPVCIERTIP